MINRTLILYVEDEESDAFLLQKALKARGYEYALKVAPDGEGAIRYLSEAVARDAKERLPALVLLDIKLPRVDGFQVLEWIRGHRVLASLPVVMYSSSMHPADMERARALGATDFVEKRHYERLREFVETLPKYWGGGG